MTNARQKLPLIEEWIQTHNQFAGPTIELPDELWVISSGHHILVEQDGNNKWFVIECYVENIDNGEGFAYCENTYAVVPENAVEKVVVQKRLNEHWVLFRFS